MNSRPGKVSVQRLSLDRLFCMSHSTFHVTIFIRKKRIFEIEIGFLFSSSIVRALNRVPSVCAITGGRCVSGIDLLATHWHLAPFNGGLPDSADLQILSVREVICTSRSISQVWDRWRDNFTILCHVLSLVHLGLEKYHLSTQVRSLPYR